MVRGTEDLANEFTPPDQIEERVYKIYPPQYREWALQHGIPQPPPGVFATPAPDQGQIDVAIASPGEGAVVAGIVPVFGSASVPGFASFEVQYGISHDPGAFSLPISGPFGAPVVNGQLGTWDTTQLENGPHTLRVLVRDQRGQEYEARVRPHRGEHGRGGHADCHANRPADAGGDFDLDARAAYADLDARNRAAN